MSITPIQQLTLAKAISPGIFKNATPKFHINVLSFLQRPSEKIKVMILPRGFGKSTLINKVSSFNYAFMFEKRFIIIVSENAKKAKSFLKDIKRIVDRAHDLKYDVHRGETWNENTIEIMMDSDPKTGKPTRMCQISAFGAGEDPRGYVSDNNRPDLIIVDDFESRESVRKEELRAKNEEYFFQDLLPALEPDGDVWVIGTIMHAAQLLSKLANMEDMCEVLRLGCFDERGESIWKSRFPKEKLLKIKARYERMGLINAFPNEYLNIPQSDEKKLFKNQYFKKFRRVIYAPGIYETKSFANALESSSITILTPTHIELMDGTKIPYNELYITSTMDLASKKGKDKTVIVTRGVDSQGNKYILDISAGHWNPFERAIEAMRVYMQFRPVSFGIEKASMQNDFFYTLDVAQKEFGIYIPVVELKHGNIDKNIRISRLHPSYVAGQIYHNESDPNTIFLEAQLGAFTMDIQGEDDIIDTAAYQEDFTVGRSFDEWEEDEYDDNARYG